MSMKKITKVAAVAVSSFLVLGLGNVAAFASTLPAAFPPARPPLVKPVPRPHIHGTIASVSSSLLTLKTADKTVNVKLSSSTVYDRGPAQSLTLSDLKAGAEVNVEGAWENGSFNALRVHLEVPHIHGTIASVSSSLLTLKTADKTVNVKLSSSTVYDRGPAQSLTLSDLKAGLEVNVEGAWDNGTFDALRIHLDPLHRDGLPGRPGKKPDGLGGMIQSVSGQSLTIKAPDGRTFIVALTGSTKLHSGPQSLSTSALQAGKEVHIRLVSGEQVPLPSTSSTQTITNLTATDVDLVPPHWDGTITGVQGTSVTLETKDGQTVTLNLNSNTVIKYGPGSTSSQLAVGMKVHVEGTANGSTISPARIDVHP